MKAPSHLTAAQIKHALAPRIRRILVRIAKGVLTEQEIDFAVNSACHPQRIKREMLKLGACKFHGTLMLESTEATQFILSHVSEDLHASDTANTATTSPQG